jgi:hypothetical protein
MKRQLSTVSFLSVLVAGGACSSPAMPPDIRPLGNVTSTPRECDLISAKAIKLATGLDDYTAYGTKMDSAQRFASCTVREDLTPGAKRGLLIELFDPSENDAEDLANTKLSTRGKDLPNGLGPGFAGRRKNAQEETIAFVYGWTSDYKRLLVVSLLEGAPGRDSLADATEFFRQLKPALLDNPS